MGAPEDQDMTKKAKIHFPDPVSILDLQEGVAPPTAVPTSRSQSDPQSCRDPMSTASRPLPSFCTFHPLRVQLQAVHQEACHSLLLFPIPLMRTWASVFPICVMGGYGFACYHGPFQQFDLNTFLAPLSLPKLYTFTPHPTSSASSILTSLSHRFTQQTGPEVPLLSDDGGSVLKGLCLVGDGASDTSKDK